MLLLLYTLCLCCICIYKYVYYTYMMGTYKMCVYIVNHSILLLLLQNMGEFSNLLRRHHRSLQHSQGRGTGSGYSQTPSLHSMRSSAHTLVVGVGGGVSGSRSGSLRQQQQGGGHTHTTTSTGVGVVVGVGSEIRSARHLHATTTHNTPTIRNNNTTTTATNSTTTTTNHIHNTSAPSLKSYLPPLTTINSTQNSFTHSNSTLAPLPSLASPTNLTGRKTTAYSIGDRVDGHCTLPNGTKRWYPGSIVDINYDPEGRIQAVVVKFQDGEEKTLTDMTDIRYPKKKKPRGKVWVLL